MQAREMLSQFNIMEKLALIKKLYVQPFQKPSEERAISPVTVTRKPVDTCVPAIAYNNAVAPRGYSFFSFRGTGCLPSEQEYKLHLRSLK